MLNTNKFILSALTITIIAVLMLSVPYFTTTAYGTTAATLTIPVGAATPGNPSYDPVSLTVKKGDTIDVINEDSSPHTVTNGRGPDDPAAGKKFDTSIIRPGTSDDPKRVEIMTANLEPGEYDFHCAVHPFMTGQIIVSPTEKEEQEEPPSSIIVEPENQVIPDEPQIEQESPSIDFDIFG